MKIKLYTNEGCANCKKVKLSLQRILQENDLTYASAVSELDIGNSDILAELLMMGAQTVPVVVMGNVSLSGGEALREDLLRDLVGAHLSMLR